MDIIVTFASGSFPEKSEAISVLAEALPRWLSPEARTHQNTESFVPLPFLDQTRSK